MFASLYFIVNFCVILSECLVPRVKISQGELSGVEIKLFNDKVVNAYLSIPFAIPPVEQLRFEEPQPYPAWPGSWNGSQFTRFCLQYNNLMGMVVGEEDCLYVNVFTPKNNQNDLLDVLVWFHGGSFIQGSGNYLIPEYLLAYHDVIFVAVNYRLGPFGFLSTDDHVVPGNNGLKDQVMALRWVQTNIEKFGGNPKSVTIAGSSAGASSVHLHLLSPLSKGLFHKAIMHSGTALQPWLFLGKTVPVITKQHATLLGCPVISSTEMIECLKKRPAFKIATLGKDTMIWRHLGLQFGPVIESVGRNNFITENPITLIRNTRIKIPFLMSITADEGYIGLHNFIENESVLEELDNRFNEIAPYMLYYFHKFDETRMSAFGDKIREYFFNNESINTKENYKKLVEVLGDRLIRAYVRFAVREHSLKKSGPIYFCKFNYAGEYSITNRYANNYKSYGASHGDDMQYIMRPLNQPLMKRADDIEMTKLVTSMWASFMKNGKPRVGNIEWTSVSSDPSKTGLTYLNINSANNLRIDHYENTNGFEFWNKSLNEFPPARSINTHEEL